MNDSVRGRRLPSADLSRWLWRWAGRFVLTPQAPLMIAGHQLSLTRAGPAGAMNGLGYLPAAWNALPARRAATLRAGLAGAIALTPLSAVRPGPGGVACRA